MADQQVEEDKSSAGAPYCYPPHHHHISSSSNLMASNIQTSSFNFERSKYSTNDDVDQIYDLTTGVEMIGFHHHNKTGTRSGAVATTTDFYNQLQQQGGGGGGLIMTGSRRSNHVNDLLMGGVDDDECAGNRSSLRCVSFPCEGNERPSQGLSLSLNSNNPSSISLQSFELRRPPAANTPPPTTTTTTISHQHQGSTAAGGTHNDFMRFISPSSSSPNWPNTSRYHDHGYHVGKQPSSSSTNFVGGSSVTTGTGHHDEFNDHHHQASGSGQHFVALSYSMYFPAAQELLNEFCSLGTKVADDSGHNNKKKQQYNNWDDQQNDINIINGPNSSSGTGGGNCSSSSREQQSILYALDLLELQKRKRRLLAMLEELERRYRNYSNQMKSVVSSFEAVAGDGSASVYTSLASKAMSRHFRCLKDGIVTQIKVFNKVIAEKDPSSSSAAAAAAGTSTTTAGGGGGGGGGITKGETPRLRILDQTLRQQRAYQQMSMMETHPWRPQRGLPERSVSLLRAWLFEHFLHPYPSDVDKHILARQTGLTRSQVSNWFINARVRLWKPMVEEMYLEETKEEQEKFMASSSSHHEHHDQLLINNSNENNDGIICNNNNHLLNDGHANYGLQTTMQQPQQDIDDQKPNVDALIRFGRDSQCISSIITANNNINPDKNINKSIKIPAAHHHANNTSLHLHDQQQEEQGNYGRGVEPFGPIDIDFASYNENAHQHHHHHSFGGVAPGSGSNTAAGAGGVSLTLGLQQNGGNNIGGAAGPVNLAFSNPAATATMHVEHSLYYPTGDNDDRMVEPAVHEYSLFDGDHGAQNLPYRNLMGAQMLHDFA